MKENTFRVKSYSKTELARMYNPCMCDRSAQYTLMQWIDHNIELTKQLIKTGFRKADRTFTPKQVEIIVEHLGEP